MTTSQTDRLDEKIKRLQKQIDEEKRRARPVSTEDFQKKPFDVPAPADKLPPFDHSQCNCAYLGSVGGAPCSYCSSGEYDLESV